MSFPEYDNIYGTYFGSDDGPYLKLPTIGLESNFASNPAYTSSNFLAAYPQFTGYVPDAMITAFVAIGNASLDYGIWNELWAYAMGLYIGHLCTLYLLRTNSADTPDAVAASGAPIGRDTSESVGPASYSTEYPAGMDNFGSFGLTSYGQELMTLVDIVSPGIYYQP